MTEIDKAEDAFNEDRKSYKEARKRYLEARKSRAEAPALVWICAKEWLKTRAKSAKAYAYLKKLKYDALCRKTEGCCE